MTDQELLALPRVKPEDAAKYLQNGTSAQEIRIFAQRVNAPSALRYSPRDGDGCTASMWAC